MTSGEKRFSERLEQKLEDDYLLWYDVAIGPRQRRAAPAASEPSRGGASAATETGHPVSASRRAAT